jgi:hypothetical protein
MNVGMRSSLRLSEGLPTVAGSAVDPRNVKPRRQDVLVFAVAR